jgi:hypothetical protein
MKKFILWGLGASPYQLKMQSLLDFTGHDWERWPQQAGRRAGLSMALRLAVAKHRGKIQRFPAMSAEFDEYPAVPFHTSNGTSFYYDSSSMAYQLELLAPRIFRWLCAIRGGRQNEGCGDLALTPSLEPLLRIIMSTFGVLMQQNEKAYEQAAADGETVFNEAAFDRHRALYDGHLLGYPFRAVAKTFQVRVWRELKESWQAHEAQDRESLEQELLPDAGIAFSRRSEL